MDPFWEGIFSARTHSQWLKSHLSFFHFGKWSALIESNFEGICCSSSKLTVFRPAWACVWISQGAAHAGLAGTTKHEWKWFPSAGGRWKNWEGEAPDEPSPQQVLGRWGSAGASPSQSPGFNFFKASGGVGSGLLQTARTHPWRLKPSFPSREGIFTGGTPVWRAVISIDHGR